MRFWTQQFRLSERRASNARKTPPVVWNDEQKPAVIEEIVAGPQSPARACFIFGPETEVQEQGHPLPRLSVGRKPLLDDFSPIGKLSH